MRRYNLINKMIGGMAALAAVGALMAASAPSAQAAFLLRLTDVATNTTVLVQDDTLAGVLTGSGTTTTADSGAGAGMISFNGAIAGTIWNVNVTTGLSKPILGAGPQKIDLLSVHVSSGGSGSLRIELTDTGFVSGIPSPYFTAAIGGTTSGSLTLNHAAVDPNNGQFANTVDITGGGLGPFTGGAFSGSAGNWVNVGAGVPFSMTLSATITHVGAGQLTSFDADISVPEPGTLGMFGLGLLGLGFLWRRRNAHQDLAA